jgi:hypothetical protein
MFRISLFFSNKVQIMIGYCLSRVFLKMSDKSFVADFSREMECLVLILSLLSTTGWRRRPQKRNSASGDLRVGDPDVYRPEEQQKVEGPLRPVLAHQVGHTSSANFG